MNFRPIMEAMKQGKPVQLCTLLEGPEAGRSIINPGLALSGCTEVDGIPCYVEEYAPPARLVILGAGHVGTAVARAAAFVGFEVRVVDFRPELLEPARFPLGTQLSEAPFDDLSGVLPSVPAYYLVTTNSHQSDYQCAAQVLRRPFLFAGMLGSRKKSALVRQWLLRDGIDQEQIDLLFSPVGLNIGAETPEEIAVSIVAQLVEQRSRQPANHIPSDLAARLAKPDCSGVLITVIRKEGSAPRGPGSKLLVCQDGSTCGTVGGGIVEYESIELARTLDTFALRSFRSGSGEAGVMACGGQMELMFQPVENE